MRSWVALATLLVVVGGCGRLASLGDPFVGKYMYGQEDYAGRIVLHGIEIAREGEHYVAIYSQAIVEKKEAATFPEGDEQFRVTLEKREDFLTGNAGRDKYVLQASNLLRVEDALIGIRSYQRVP